MRLLFTLFIFYLFTTFLFYGRELATPELYPQPSINWKRVDYWEYAPMEGDPLTLIGRALWNIVVAIHNAFAWLVNVVGGIVDTIVYMFSVLMYIIGKVLDAATFAYVPNTALRTILTVVFNVVFFYSVYRAVSEVIHGAGGGVDLD